VQFLLQRKHTRALAEEIRRQLKEEIEDPPLSDTAIERFIQIVEKVVAQFPVKDRIEISSETDTPLISHCRLGGNALREIMVACQAVFDAAALKKIEQFIDHANDYNGPMTFLLKRSFAVRREEGAVPAAAQAHPCSGRRAAQFTK